MKARVRDILMECIAAGIERGIVRAYKIDDRPGDELMSLHIDECIWQEIDSKFDFEEQT